MKNLRLLVILILWAIQINVLAEDSIKQAAHAPKKILFMGDSISVGVGTSCSAKRYTTLVTNMLNEDNVNFKEINVAISGSTLVDHPWPKPGSSGYPHILKKTIEQKPDIFIIQHGTNDNAIGSSLEEFLWAYRQVIITIKEELPQTQIVCMTICPSWDVTNSSNDWLNQANIGIQEIAAIEKVLIAHVNFKLYNQKELFPDGVHPNDKGHKNMAESVVEAIKANKIQSKEKFDFICNGTGQYRICGYIFNIVPNDLGDTSWTYFYNIKKDGFTYCSDYVVKISTPFKLYEKDFKTIVVSKKSKDFEVKSSWNNYNGTGNFILSETQDNQVELSIH
ncbi:SGNH/GDSL hydrolase family protein [Planctomycetota bacterium]